LPLSNCCLPRKSGAHPIATLVPLIEAFIGCAFVRPVTTPVPFPLGEGWLVSVPVTTPSRLYPQFFFHRLARLQNSYSHLVQRFFFFFPGFFSFFTGGPKLVSCGIPLFLQSFQSLFFPPFTCFRCSRLRVFSP